MAAGERCPNIQSCAWLALLNCMCGFALKDHLLGLERVCDRLRSHSVRDELIVQVRNGINEVAPTTVNEDAIFMTENLTQPSSASTAFGVHVDIEPEPLLVTSSVERGEEFSGTDVKKSGSHRSPGNGSLTLESLTSLISLIELDLTQEVVQREKSINNVIDGSITAVIAVVNKDRIRVVSQFAATLREKISLSGF